MTLTINGREYRTTSPMDLVADVLMRARSGGCYVERIGSQAWIASNPNGDDIEVRVS